jgi:hypothetical protein
MSWPRAILFPYPFVLTAEASFVKEWVEDMDTLKIRVDQSVRCFAWREIEMIGVNEVGRRRCDCVVGAKSLELVSEPS